VGHEATARCTSKVHSPSDLCAEPGCFDRVFLQFNKDRMAGHTPDLQSVGISYMYGGKWVTNKSHATGRGDEFPGSGRTS
jgi:hypothetical protein